MVNWVNDFDKAQIIFQLGEKDEIEHRSIPAFETDYILADELREELHQRMNIETISFHHLNSIRIEDDACVDIIIPYLWCFPHVGFAEQLITQHFWRKGNHACSDFLEAWTKHCIAAGMMGGTMETTLDNAFIHIQDKRKALFYVDLMQAGYDFPFTMEMLGRWRVPEALPIILDRIHDPTYLLLQNAVRALAGYKNPQHLPLFRELLSESGVTQKAAAMAIRRIERKQATEKCVTRAEE